MDIQVIILYCLTDDMLHGLGHSEPPQRSMSDAEVIATALVAMRLFGGNFASARLYLESEGYVPRMLSKSQFNRRLHRVAPKLKSLFLILARVHKNQSDEDVYLVDSFLRRNLCLPVCDNIRISRCSIYPLEATGGVYRGYIASKRRFFYGLRIHLIAGGRGPSGRGLSRSRRRARREGPEAIGSG